MTLADKIGITSNLILVLTLLATGLTIWWQLRKANEDRENGTYDSLDERFTRFLEICIQYPELEVYNPARDNWAELSAQDARRQLILYQILVSIFERAYLLYNETHVRKSKTRRNQWEGWVRYIRYYSEHPTFLYAWMEEKIGEDMDTSFQRFMTSEIRIGCASP